MLDSNHPLFDRKGGKRMRGRAERPLTKSITAKVAEAEEKRLRDLAAEQGLTLSEWTRKTLLQAADFPQPERILLEEIEAVRSLCLTAYAQVAGVKVEEVEAFYKRVNRQLDQQKQAKADQRMLESQTQQTQAKETAA